MNNYLTFWMAPVGDLKAQGYCVCTFVLDQMMPNVKENARLVTAFKSFTEKTSIYVMWDMANGDVGVKEWNKKYAWIAYSLSEALATRKAHNRNKNNAQLSYPKKYYI